MPRLLPKTAVNVILRVKLLTDGGSPIVDLAHDAAGLIVRYRRQTDTTWQTITLVAGAAAVYGPSHWIGIGGGWHELGLPIAAIVAGQRTEIEIVFGSNQPQADSIDAVLGLSDAEITAVADEVADQLRASADQFFSSDQLAQTREIRVIQRDDYNAADGRAFDIGYEKPGVDFTGATVVAGAGLLPGVPVITPTVSLVDAAVGSVTIRLQFTSAQLTVAPGRYQWDAHIVLSSRRNTVVSGICIVDPKYADAPPAP